MCPNYSIKPLFRTFISEAAFTIQDVIVEQKSSCKRQFEVYHGAWNKEIEEQLFSERYFPHCTKRGKVVQKRNQIFSALKVYILFGFVFSGTFHDNNSFIDNKWNFGLVCNSKAQGPTAKREKPSSKLSYFLANCRRLLLRNVRRNEIRFLMSFMIHFLAKLFGSFRTFNVIFQIFHFFHRKSSSWLFPRW